MNDFSFENDEYKLKVLDRIDTWMNVAKAIISKYEGEFGDKIWTLNHEILLLSATSYVDDIFKFKLYSKSKLASRYKIASYTLKWLTKIKPIQIANTVRKISPSELLINNLFAITCAYAALDLKPEELSQDKVFLSELNYNLLYRTISGKNYSLTFRVLEELIKAKREIS